jgi:hypothetical protein
MKLSFPWAGLGLGLLLSLVLLRFGTSDDSRHTLPLLAALLMSEFGLLVTGIAAVIGVRDLVRKGFLQPLVVMLILGNLLLAAFFLRTGIALWPGSTSGLN